MPRTCHINDKAYDKHGDQHDEKRRNASETAALARHCVELVHDLEGRIADEYEHEYEREHRFAVLVRYCARHLVSREDHEYNYEDIVEKIGYILRQEQYAGHDKQYDQSEYDSVFHYLTFPYRLSVAAKSANISSSSFSVKSGHSVPVKYISE